MKLKVIATGSAGNCYVLERDNGEKLLLDVGVPVKDILQGIDYNLKSVKAVCITHRHQDHCLSKHHLEKMGLRIFAPYDDGKKNTICGDWYIHAFDLPHNGTENYGFIVQIDNKTILYLTDFEYCQYTFKGYKPDYIIVECNYQKEYINENLPNLTHKVMGHCELNTTKDFVLANKTENLKDIVIVHTSSFTCNKDEIKDIIERESGCLVHIAEKDLEIELTADVPF